MLIDVRAEKRQRQRSTLEEAIGPALATLFDDDAIREIDINDDGSVWVEHALDGTQRVEQMHYSADQAEQIATAIAAELARIDPHAILDADHQALDGKLDYTENNFVRVSLTAPPAVAQHTIEIRKHSSIVKTLEQQRDEGLLLPSQYDGTLELIERKKNIMILGAMFSGKTTLGNSLVSKIAQLYPTRRFGYLEDVREMVCPMPNKKAVLSTSAWPISRWMKQVVRWNLRSVSITELRDGLAAYLLLTDLWAQDHDGGITTFHGGRWRQALGRAEALMRSAGYTPERSLIASSIGGIVQLEYDERQKRRQVAGVYELLDDLDSNKEYQVKALSEERSFAGHVA